MMEQKRLNRKLRVLPPMNKTEQDNLPKIKHNYGYYIVGDEFIFGNDEKVVFGLKIKSIK